MDLSNADRGRSTVGSATRFASERAMQASFEEGVYATRRVASVDKQIFDQEMGTTLARMAGTTSGFRADQTDPSMPHMQVRAYEPYQSMFAKFAYGKDQMMYPNHKIIVIWDQHVLVDQLE